MWAEKNNQLVSKYRQWFAEIQEKAPLLLGDCYSNPDYMSIPDGWFETSGPRIMVVGEERFGPWGNGKGPGGEPALAHEIEKIQKFHFDYLEEQLGREKEKWNSTKYWQRFRKVAEHGVCCWTNIDKFHRLGDSDCALSQKERRSLHSVDTKILREEISILNPTHIIFFGWHGTSLLYELPELYDCLYPDEVWKRGEIPVKNYEGKPCVFSYHPAYRRTDYKEYEDQVMETFRATL